MNKTVTLIKCRKGFTLIELLIVIVIIAILIALLVPTYNGFRDKMMENACVSNLKSVYGSLRQYASSNGGNYPLIDHYYGNKFSGTFVGPGVNTTVWDALKPIQVLKEYGASAKTFFCPYHSSYEQDHWQYNSWESPIITTSSSGGQTKRIARVDFGYTFFINRGMPWGGSFADGRPCVRNTNHGDDLPLAADDLHYRQGDTYRPGSWWHGGGREEGVFNSDCNTLLGNGTVVNKDWGFLEEQGPGIKVGSASDMWWFYLGRENYDN